MNEEMLQYQVYTNQLKQIAEYLQELTAQKQNMQSSKDALFEIKKTKLKSKVLAQIATGIFIETELLSNTEVITNLNANTAKKRTVDETIELVTKEIESIEKYEREIGEQKNQISHVLELMKQNLMQKNKINDEN